MPKGIGYGKAAKSPLTSKKAKPKQGDSKNKKKGK
jgi:hypothetical protein